MCDMKAIIIFWINRFYSCKHHGVTSFQQQFLHCSLHFTPSQIWLWGINFICTGQGRCVRVINRFDIFDRDLVVSLVPQWCMARLVHVQWNLWFKTTAMRGRPLMWDNSWRFATQTTKVTEILNLVAIVPCLSGPYLRKY